MTSLFKPGNVQVAPVTPPFRADVTEKGLYYQRDTAKVTPVTPVTLRGRGVCVDTYYAEGGRCM